MRQITVGKNDAGQRLDKFLTKTYTKLPQSMLYKGIRTKNIKLNGKRCQISSRIQEGDIISLYLKEEIRISKIINTIIIIKTIPLFLFSVRRMWRSTPRPLQQNIFIYIFGRVFSKRSDNLKRTILILTFLIGETKNRQNLPIFHFIKTVKCIMRYQ